ncbi:hypothetical protein PRUB_a5311 [Pseudoalteromonas rubra]|uniref:Uncharacterized protein n=1 Tax=Pseudoalteromonas rubra TaxID=43658 RepID=A0A8T0C3Z2_9GAMM|nr:hypothetical protein PRUB_a5311 [Pseudoalteromonas rubra]
MEGSRLGVHASRSLRCEAVLRSQFTHVKVGHRQGPIKETRCSNAAGFLRLEFKKVSMKL